MSNIVPFPGVTLTARETGSEPPPPPSGKAAPSPVCAAPIRSDDFEVIGVPSAARNITPRASVECCRSPNGPRSSHGSTRRRWSLWRSGTTSARRARNQGQSDGGVGSAHLEDEHGLNDHDK